MEILSERLQTTIIPLLQKGFALDVLQTMVLLICVFYGMFLYHRISDKRKYIYLISAMACVALGDVLLYASLLFLGALPSGFSGTDLAYAGLYIFLATTCLHLRKEWSTRRKLDCKKNYPWGTLAAVITAFLSIIAISVSSGPRASRTAQLLFMVLQIMLAWISAYMLASSKHRSRKFHLLVFLIFSFDFLSGFFAALRMYAVHYVFDFALTVCFPFLLPVAHGIKKRRSSHTKDEHEDE